MIIALESYPSPRARAFFLAAFTPLNQNDRKRDRDIIASGTGDISEEDSMNCDLCF